MLSSSSPPEETETRLFKALNMLINIEDLYEQENTIQKSIQD